PPNTLSTRVFTSRTFPFYLPTGFSQPSIGYCLATDVQSSHESLFLNGSTFINSANCDGYGCSVDGGTSPSFLAGVNYFTLYCDVGSGPETHPSGFSFAFAYSYFGSPVDLAFGTPVSTPPALGSSPTYTPETAGTPTATSTSSVIAQT